MTTQDISDLLGLTTQQVRNIARSKGWSVVREGKRGPGAGSLFNRKDVEAEAKERLQQAKRDVRRIEAWLRGKEL